MSHRIGTSASVFSQPPTLQSEKTNDLYSLRRILHPGLVKMKEMIQSSSMNDPLSSFVLLWCQEFKKALMLQVDEYKVLSEFRLQLQKFLIDPITGEPLNEHSLLGRDGYTYHPSTKIRFYRDVLNGELHASHLDYANVHPLIGEILQWQETLSHYESKNQNLPSPKRQFAQIKSSSRISTRESETDLLLSILKTQHRRDEEQSKKQQMLMQHLNAFRDEMVGNFKEQNKDREERAQKQQAKEIQKIDALQTKESLMRKELEQELDELHKTIDSLQEKNTKLSAIIDGINQTISSIERAELELERSIHAIEIARMQHKKSWFDGLGSALLVTAGCVFATWALGAALSSIGSTASATAIPISNGFKLTLSFPI